MKRLIPILLVGLLLWDFTVVGAQTSVEMAPPSIPVAPAIEEAVQEILSADPPAPTADYYAITDVSVYNYQYTFASVVGLTDLITPTLDWNLFDNGVWTGSILLDTSTITITGALEGTPEFTAMLPDLGMSDLLTISGSALIFPWKPGSSMRYGPRGVHSCGFSLADWKAVDFGSDGNTGAGHAPNTLYASAGGKVSYVCRDSTQVAIRIGNTLYDHLVDNGVKLGDQYSQGEPLSSMVQGQFSDKCGWAEQQPTSFHVHWCFPPTGSITVENWTLNTGSQTWSNGSSTVSINGWLKANGTGAPPPPSGGGDTGNLWGHLLEGIKGLMTWLVYGRFPSHTQIGIVNMVVDLTSTGLGVLFILFFTQVNPTFPLIAIGVITISEGSRGVYKLYQLVKNLIPMA